MVTYFNQPMGIRELGLGQSLLIWYPISVSEYVLNPNLDNLDNSIMDKKQVVFTLWLIYVPNGV